MREIKFRAWDVQNNKMIEVEKIDFKGELNPIFNLMTKPCINSSIPFDRIELMQFTGLHDKNGKEIYEGDIMPFRIFVKCSEEESTVISNGEHQKRVLTDTVVRFNPDRFCYELYSKKYREERPFYLWRKEIQDGEVVGNIYEKEAKDGH